MSAIARVRNWVLKRHTVPVVVEICELVVPLCQYAQRVFEESDDDQEAADCWQISIQDFRQLQFLIVSFVP
jgi:hypothetical protein